MPDSQKQNSPQGRERQKEPIKYFFSPRALILSFVFLLLSLVLFAVSLNTSGRVLQDRVTPKLIFADNQEVFIKSPYNNDYVSANPNQDFLTDSLLKTGDRSFAEIRLLNNVIRLDQNTELQLLENNFGSVHEPRLTFKLNSGNVWVSAVDLIEIDTPRAQAHFETAVGSYSYNKPLNRVLSFVGNVDLKLLNDDGDVLKAFTIPLKNNVAFADFQIIQDYSRLEYSKLRKELKLGPIAQVVLDDEWVKRNSMSDSVLYSGEFETIDSAGDYKLRDRYYALREFLTFFPDQKAGERMSRIETQIRYLLGGVQKGNLIAETDELLQKLDELVRDQHGNTLLTSLFDKHFFAIRNVKTTTPAYKLKEYLRGYLFTKNNTQLLRTYLADVNFLMNISEMGQAEKVAGEWLKKWEANSENRFDEFETQARLYHNLMLAHSERVTAGLLAISDDLGELRLKFTDNSEEALFEIALERLEMSKYLLANFRYEDAGSYLKNSYANLGLSEKATSRAARDIFIKEAALLGDRIAFALESLKGSAEEIDETEFTDYLSTQERDKSLEERFTSFIESTEPEEEVVKAPTPGEVSDRFSRLRIVLLEEDIEVNPELPFEFEIKTARFLDPADDGSTILFSALYDFASNAIYDIRIGDDTLAGNFTLKDFVRVALTSTEVAEEPVEAVEDVKPDFTDFLSSSESDAAEFSQLVAEDLAIRLMIKELDALGIPIGSSRQVSVLDPLTLDRFRILNVTLEDNIRDRRIVTAFDYNSTTKMASNIMLSESDVIPPTRVKIDQLILSVFNAVYGKEEEAQATSDVIKVFNSFDLVLENGDFEFIDASINQVRFNKTRIKNMPVEFSGVYDRNFRLFISASHELLTVANVSVRNYLENLSGLFVIDYLLQKGIPIGSENIISKLPTSKVLIKDYILGEKVLDFTFDISNNRLLDISIQGTDTRVDSMTFAEFSRVR